MKPLIGVVAHTGLNPYKMPATIIPLAYTGAIERAGGIPLILPFTENHEMLTAMMAPVLGILIPGGRDMDPSLYDQKAIPEVDAVDATLDRFQMAVIEIALARELPMLAICRGAQVANVALGGTLIQDIGVQIEAPTLEHMQATLTFDTDHGVVFSAGSRLRALFGPRIMINSRHHQAIDKPGAGLVVTAHSPDGVIEAAQHETLPVDLVQWHPELMLQKNNDMLPLFRSFVERCQHL